MSLLIQYTRTSRVWVSAYLHTSMPYRKYVSLHRCIRVWMSSTHSAYCCVRRVRKRRARAMACAVSQLLHETHIDVVAAHSDWVGPIPIQCRTHTGQRATPCCYFVQSTLWVRVHSTHSILQTHSTDNCNARCSLWPLCKAERFLNAHAFLRISHVFDRCARGQWHSRSKLVLLMDWRLLTNLVFRLDSSYNFNYKYYDDYRSGVSAKSRIWNIVVFCSSGVTDASEF